MTEQKSSFLNMLVTLVVVTGVSAVSLGFVHQWTREPIEAARIERQMRAIKAVVGQHNNDPLQDAFQVQREKNDKGWRYRKRHRTHGQQEKANKEALTFYPSSLNDEPKTMAIGAFSTNGYSGRIDIMVGIDPDGSIRNIQVVDHKETPGLGSKISDETFVSQWIGKSPENFDMRVTKDGGQVDAISGATISSRAFSEAVQQAFDAFNQVTNEEGSQQ